MTLKFFHTLFTIFLVTSVFSQSPTANAGNDFTLCPNIVYQLGGSPTATGGTPPYRYFWNPTTGLSSSAVPNPTVSITGNATYYLTVRDTNDMSAFDTINITVDPIAQYGAGQDTSLCLGSTTGVTIGGGSNASAVGYTFSWLPVTGLNNSNAPNPIATPSTSIVYSLTVAGAVCTMQTGTVHVGIRGLNLLADHDTTIFEGVTVTLIAHGALNYDWTPKNAFIKYDDTATPDVNPYVTTTYTVFGTDPQGCYGSDTVRVNVIPSDDLVFYSAFTPNGDGINDTYYIGNIGKYPDNLFKVYNRYGQVIYTSSGYNNDWDGSYQGNKVPTGTYFYILDTGTDKGKFKGTVTIMR